MSGGVTMDGLNEVGGIFGGIIGLMVATGAGLRWLLNWTERRQESRAAKLQAWGEELKARELRLDAERENEIVDIRRELEKVSGENHALFQAYHILTAGLIRLDPSNPALKQAAALLNMGFSFDATFPAAMAAELRKMP